MTEYVVPLLLLAVLFVGFGLAHGNGRGAFGCAGCTGSCDPSECKKERNAPDSDEER